MIRFKKNFSRVESREGSVFAQKQDEKWIHIPVLFAPSVNVPILDITSVEQAALLEGRYCGTYLRKASWINTPVLISTDT